MNPRNNEKNDTIEFNVPGLHVQNETPSQQLVCDEDDELAIRAKIMSDTQKCYTEEEKKTG